MGESWAKWPILKKTGCNRSFWFLANWATGNWTDHNWLQLATAVQLQSVAVQSSCQSLYQLPTGLQNTNSLGPSNLLTPCIPYALHCKQQRCHSNSDLWWPMDHFFCFQSPGPKLSPLVRQYPMLHLFGSWSPQHGLPLVQCLSLKIGNSLIGENKILITLSQMQGTVIQLYICTLRHWNKITISLEFGNSDFQDTRTIQKVNFRQCCWRFYIWASELLHLVLTLCALLMPPDQFSKIPTFIIMLGPQRWWDLYFFTANSACLALSPFLYNI